MPYDSTPREQRVSAYLDQLLDRDRDRQQDWREGYLPTHPERELPPRPVERTDRPPPRMSQAEWYAIRSPGMYDEEGRRIANPLAEIVNDPNVTVTVEERKAINDPKKGMLPSGKIVRMDQVGGRSPLYPPLKMKRTRKKTKTDRTMSSCLKEANARYRKKNGQLKKGKSQSDVMRLAHRLCKKEMNKGTKKGQVRKTARRAYKF